MKLQVDVVKEPSTWAGIGLVAQSIGMLLASKGADTTAWVGLVAGLVAIFRREVPKR